MTIEDHFNEVSVPCPVCQEVVRVEHVQTSCFYMSEYQWRDETEAGRQDIMAEMKTVLERKIAHLLVANGIAKFDVTNEDESGRVRMRAIVGFVMPDVAKARADRQQREWREKIENLRRSIHATINWGIGEGPLQMAPYSRHDANIAVDQCFDFFIENQGSE